jgi:hypothetical protein
MLADILKFFAYVGLVLVSGNPTLHCHIDNDAGDRADLRKVDLDPAVT